MLGHTVSGVGGKSLLFFLSVEECEKRRFAWNAPCHPKIIISVIIYGTFAIPRSWDCASSWGASFINPDNPGYDHSANSLIGKANSAKHAKLVGIWMYLSLLRDFRVKPSFSRWFPSLPGCCWDWHMWAAMLLCWNWKRMWQQQQPLGRRKEPMLHGEWNFFWCEAFYVIMDIMDIMDTMACFDRNRSETFTLTQTFWDN